MSETLSSGHRFQIADIARFADQSLDANPIHIDPERARRLLTGGVIVHGMHSLLWTLEQHFDHGGGRLTGIAAAFLRPIHLDVPLALSRKVEEDGSWWLELRNPDEVAATFQLRPGDPLSTVELPNRNDCSVYVPKDFAFAAMKSASGVIDVDGYAEALTAVFPKSVDAMGALRVAGLMALSKLVGMECPGLHSLFAGLDVTLDGSAQNLLWRVTRHTVPQAPLVLTVAGAGLSGTLTALMRPAPVDQPSMREIASHVQAGEFCGQRALIIGGSRGLGETVAKIIAAGGGSCTITYHTGKADAERVAGEIGNLNGVCRAVQFDAEASIDEQLDRLLASSPTHLYYFATPHIGGRSARVSDPQMGEKYHRVYVDVFGELCIAAVKRSPVKAFYPSTIFVDQSRREYAEYVIAKAAGESLCAHLNRSQPGLSILCVRLPRLKTDQTAALLAKQAGETMPCMLDIVRRLQMLEEHAS